jgi:hypothetical protein
MWSTRDYEISNLFSVVQNRRNIDSKIGTDTEDILSLVVESFSCEKHKSLTLVASHRIAIFNIHAGEIGCFCHRNET